MRAYSVFDVTSFPTANRFDTSAQLDHTYTVDSTRFRQTGMILDGEFIVYTVEHVTAVRFRGTPYHHAKPLDEVSEKHSFEAYLYKDRTFVLMHYAKDICREAAARLSRLEEKTKATAPKLDLLQLVEHFPHLVGVYFGDIRAPNVKSSSLFGSDVDESEFYRTFKELGVLSALLTNHVHEGEPHKLMITRDYGIGFYKDLGAPKELEVFMSLKPKLDSCRAKVEARVQPAEEKQLVEDLGLPFQPEA